jgi:hypothetical protein
MLRALLLAPLVITALGVMWPLSYYARMRTNHETAIGVLHHVRALQRQLNAEARGYATDLATLIECQPDVRLAGLLERLAGAGYVLRLRAIDGDAVTVESGACRGRLSSDYYVSAAPRDPPVAAQQAFAARADGDVFVFFDGIAPREIDMAQRLATPLSARDTFVIP